MGRSAFARRFNGAEDVRFPPAHPRRGSERLAMKAKSMRTSEAIRSMRRSPNRSEWEERDGSAKPDSPVARRNPAPDREFRGTDESTLPARPGRHAERVPPAVAPVHPAHNRRSQRQPVRHRPKRRRPRRSSGRRGRPNGDLVAVRPQYADVDRSQELSTASGNFGSGDSATSEGDPELRTIGTEKTRNRWKLTIPHEFGQSNLPSSRRYLRDIPQNPGSAGTP